MEIGSRKKTQSCDDMYSDKGNKKSSLLPLYVMFSVWMDGDEVGKVD